MTRIFWLGVFSVLLCVSYASLARGESDKKPDEKLATAKPGTLWVEKEDGTLAEVPVDQLSDTGQKLVKKMAAAPTLDAGSPDGGVKMQLISLKIVKPENKTKKTNKTLKELLTSSAPLRQTCDLIELKILVDLPGKNILGLDDRASRLITFTDNLGTDLKSKAHYSLSPEKEKDNHQATFKLHSFRLPAPGATQIILKANMVIRCYEGQTTTEAKGLVPTKESTFMLGKMEVTVTEEGKGASIQFDHGKIPKTPIAFSAKTPLDFIKSVSFFGPDGKRLNEISSSSCSGGSEDNYWFTRSYVLSKNVNSVTANIVHAEKVEEIIVPIELKFGVGF